jgi:serine protease Do
MSADRTNDQQGVKTMKHFLRPYPNFFFVNLGVVATCAAAAGLALAPVLVRAQAQEMAPIFEEPSPLAIHASASGYLGVEVIDVDTDKAQTLKLKEVRGAVITLIDHDAPAGQIGLKVNDVVLAINGQNVDGAEALRRILHELPPGSKISLEISRDGNIQTLAVQLVDRKVMEHDIWSKLAVEPGPIEPAPPTGMGILGGGGDAPAPSSWHLSLFTSTLNVGAMVEPLTSQMAEYLGVQSGLMVKQVARKSEAAAAGLKAFDVILKVGADFIATSADWDRALRSNVGKPVQVTILRDRKQQTITLQVDSKHRGAVEYEDLFGPDNEPAVAELSPLFVQDFAQDLSAQAAANANALAATAQAEAEAAHAQAEALSKCVDGLHFQISQEQVEQLRKQAEAIREEMKNFKIDPEQMKALQQQSEQLRESMKNFQVDPKQIEQLRKQADELRKNLNSGQMKQFQRQMDQFRQQMQQWQQQNCEQCV